MNKMPFDDDPEMYFYYLRNTNRQIFGGVCLKKSDGKWCRGISLWSPRDRFDRNVAKRLARKRLMKAIFTKKDDLPVSISADRKSCSNTYFYYGKDFMLKSRYNVELTEQEKQIVGEPF